MVTIEFDFNYGAVIPLVVLLLFLMLFLRQSYKYPDTRFLFLAFASLSVGTFFSLIEPSDLFMSSAVQFLAHTFGAAVAGWLVAMDTYHLTKHKLKE